MGKSAGRRASTDTARRKGNAKAKSHLDHEYVEILEQAYLRFRVSLFSGRQSYGQSLTISSLQLFNGTFQQIMENKGKAVLRQSLQPFFVQWSNRPHQLGSLGILTSPARSPQESGLPSRCIIVSLSDGIIHFPLSSLDEQICTRGDSLTIAFYLLEQLATRLAAMAPSAAAISQDGLVNSSPRKKTSVASTSAGWKTLGLGNVGSYLRVPSLPGLSSTPSGSPALQKTKKRSVTGPVAQQASVSEKEAEGADWMAIGTFGLFGNKGKPKDSRAASAKLSPAAGSKAAQLSLALAQGAVNRSQTMLNAAAASETAASSSTPTDGGNVPPGDITPTAIEYATVDDELKAAIEAGLSLPTTPLAVCEAERQLELGPEVPAAAPGMAESMSKIERLERRRVWLDEPGSWRTLDCYLVSMESLIVGRGADCVRFGHRRIRLHSRLYPLTARAKWMQMTSLPPWRAESPLSPFGKHRKARWSRAFSCLLATRTAHHWQYKTSPPHPPQAGPYEHSARAALVETLACSQICRRG